MGEGDIVNQIVEFVPKIDFTKTNSPVSLFETTIRYLAGLLSGYDFLGPQGPTSKIYDVPSIVPSPDVACIISQGALQGTRADDPRLVSRRAGTL